MGGLRAGRDGMAAVAAGGSGGARSSRRRAPGHTTPCLGGRTQGTARCCERPSCSRRCGNRERAGRCITRAARCRPQLAGRHFGGGRVPACAHRRNGVGGRAALEGVLCLGVLRVQLWQMHSGVTVVALLPEDAGLLGGDVVGHGHPTRDHRGVRPDAEARICHRESRRRNEWSKSAVPCPACCFCRNGNPLC